MNGTATAADRRTAGTSLPRWLDGTMVLVGGAVFAVLFVAGAAAFAWWEYENVVERAQENATMLARVLADESARTIDTANILTRAVADDIVHAGSVRANAFDASLSQAIAGVPFVRSLSIVDGDGRIVASSNDANRGKRIEPSRLPDADGARSAGGTSSTSGAGDTSGANGTAGGLAIGRSLSGRDLADSPLARGAPPSAAIALPLRFVPLARTVALPDGRKLHIVVALNPDYLSNAYQLLLANAHRSATLIDYDGAVTASTNPALREQTLDLQRRPVLGTLFPAHDSGSYIGPGLAGKQCVVAFRALRDWPLATIVEFAHREVLTPWRRLAGSIAAIAAAALVTWSVLCFWAARSLRQNVLASRALDRLARDKASGEARNTAVLTSALDGMVTLDARGHIVEFNREAERMFRHRAQDVIGQPGEALLPDEIHALMAVNRGASRAAPRGTPVRRRLEVTARRADGKAFPVEISVVPVEVDGERYYFCTIRDLSEAKRVAHERAQLLAKYRDSSSDLRGLKNALDKHAIVSILSPDGTILYANTMLASVSGYLRDELVGQSCRLLQPDGHVEGHVVDELLGLIREGKPWAGQLVHRRRDGSLFWAASTLVPIMDVEQDIRHAFLIQTDISEQISGERAIEAAHQAELELGAGIQRGLLIRELPTAVLDCFVASFNIASRGINGDFFDLFQFDDQSFDILVGDAMGKGVPAALLGAGLKMQFSRSLVELHTRHAATSAGRDGRPSPAQVVAHVQRAMHERLHALDAFVTICYLRVDRMRGTLTWVGCGHEETMLLRRDGEPRFLHNQHPPLGVVEEDDIVEETVPLDAGDTVVLYSDGLTDAADATGERFGLARMTDTVRALLHTHRRPGTIVRGMRAAIEHFVGHTPVADDMTMLVLQLPDSDAQAGRARFEMRRELTQLRALREFVTASAAAGGLAAADASALSLATVELASNAVRHDSRAGEGPIEAVFFANADEGTVELLYAGRPFTPPAEFTPDFTGKSEGGFGLYIIHESCDAVRYEHAAGINRVVLTKRRTAEGEDGSRRDDPARARPA